MAMSNLERLGFVESPKVKNALDMLLVDRKNEFKELASSILKNIPSSISIPNWEEFILKFCLDVSDSFETWNGKKPIAPNSDLKALTILRQLGRDKTSMIQLTHLLNIAYDLAEEFKVIYKRI